MELKNYDKTLIKRPSVIFLNKVDVEGLSILFLLIHPTLLCIALRREREDA
jgi:hypothetical protein